MPLAFLLYCCLVSKLALIKNILMKLKDDLQLFKRISVQPSTSMVRTGL